VKQVLNLLNWLSSKLKIFLGKAEGALASPESKKIGSPKQIKKMFVIIGLSFLSTVVVITMMTKTNFIGKGLEDFKKQKGVKFGVTRAEVARSTEVIDPLERFDVTESKEQQCSALHERVLANEKLNRDEYIIFKQCLANGSIPGLSATQKKVLQTLANPDEELSSGARALLIRAASGEIDPNSEEGRLVNALTSDDPFAKQVANKILDPNTSDAEKKLLTDYLEGKISKEVASAAMNGGLQQALALNKAIKDGDDDAAGKIRTELALKEQQANPMSSVNSDAMTNEQEAIKAALEDQEIIIAEERRRLQGLSPAIQNIEAKLQRGEKLTPGEESVYKDYKKVKTAVDLLEKQRAQTYADYQKIMSRIQVKVGGEYSKFSSENPEIIEEYDPRAVKTAEQIITKKEKLTTRSRITPSEYELIMAIKRARSQGEEDDFEASLYPNTDPATFQQKEIQATAGSLGKMNPLKNYNLPPDLKIPTVVESAVFVSSNDSANRRVIAKILDNVYNPENNDILLPKGSKVICTTTSFDVNTKLMQVGCSKVRVGNETLDIGFNLVDSTGKSGIPGGVLRTRHKQITAAVLTDFAAGVTEFFSRYAQQQMLQNGINNLSLTNSTTGAAFQGLSGGLTKIAETLTQDLQNAPDIFFSPVGIKMVLIPQ